MEWKKGKLYELLHYIGDDPVKSGIEIGLEIEFENEPEILDRIISVFCDVIDV